jgi:hypothetical protein
MSYYVARIYPTPVHMQADFNTAVNPYFFETLSLVHASGKEKEYDLNTKITLGGGTVIVPRKSGLTMEYENLAMKSTNPSARISW